MNRPAFKNSELGPIPADWEVKRLGEILTFKNGFNAPAKDYGKGVPFISVLDILDNHSITCDSIRGKVCVTDKNRESFSVQDGDMFFMRSSETLEDVGTANVFTGKCDDAVFGGFVIRGRPFVEIDSIFLNYLLKDESHRQRVGAQGAGAQHFNIGQAGLSTVEITLPPLSEQRRIAAALSDADAWIESLDKLIEKKKLVKQGAMQALLSGKTRLPGFSGDWGEKSLGDCANISRGASPRPIEAYLSTDVEAVNWIKIGDVDADAKYITSTQEKICREGICKSKLVAPGDFLLSNSMSFGRPYITKISGCVHDGWLVIQDYQELFDTEFLYYLLGSESVLQQYKTLAAGSSVLNLNKEVVANVCVPIPVLREQCAIASVLSDLDAELASLSREKVKAERIKEGMMQELLTGRTRVGGFAARGEAQDGEEGQEVRALSSGEIIHEEKQ